MRWSMWDEIRRLQRDMDRMFESLLTHVPSTELVESKIGGLSNFREPLSDIWEDDKEITVKMEMPGVEKDDIVVTAKNGGLEIKVLRKDEYREENKSKGFYRIERRYAGFYRYLPLPPEADLEKVNASYKNGVLELRIPKKESKKEKKIEIK